MWAYILASPKMNWNGEKKVGSKFDSELIVAIYTTSYQHHHGPFLRLSSTIDTKVGAPYSIFDTNIFSYRVFIEIMSH